MTRGQGYITAIATLAFVAFGSLAGAAQTPLKKLKRQTNPQFAGTWELDIKASTDPTPLLEAAGASFMVRQVGPRVGMTQEITQYTDRLEVARKALIFTEDITLFYDGRNSPSKDLNGNPVTMTSGWNVEKTTLVTVVPTKLDDDSMGVMTGQRYIDDKGRIIIDMALKTPKGVLYGRRIFRRTSR